MPIEDVKGYNRALGKLWCVYGVLFTLIGLPLLVGKNSGLIILPILGAMVISIAAMVVYVIGIEHKYRKINENFQFIGSCMIDKETEYEEVLGLL